MRRLRLVITPSKRSAHEPVPCLPSQRTVTRLSPEAVEQDLALARGQALPRLVERDAELARQRPPRCWRSSRCPCPGAVAPRLDRALADRQVGVGDDQVGVDLQARAEAVAVDAHAERAVERERLRRQLGEADAAVRAGARLAVGARAAPRPRRRPAPSPPPALSAVSTESVRRARSLGADGDAVDHDLDGVLLLLVERG